MQKYKIKEIKVKNNSSKSILPAMLVTPSVLGEESLLSQELFDVKIHFESKSSIIPVSCNDKMHNDNLSTHGFPFFSARP
jgi:hypothetical protein